MAKLSLDALKIINLIKLTGSFSTTARLMNKTPSAISYRVICLERNLGVKLFDRNGPLISLTKEGENIATEGEWILKAIDNLECKLMIKNPRNPVFNLGVSESFSINLLGRSLHDFSVKYPKIKIKINKMKDGSEWGDLESSKLDFVISNISCPSQVDVKSKFIGENKLIFCAAPEYIERNHKKIWCQKDAEDELLAIITNSSLDSHVRYDITQLKIKNKILVNDFFTQFSLLEEGYGIGIVPMLAVKKQLDNQTLSIVDLGYELGREPVWVGWENRNPSRYKSWWIEELDKLKIAIQFDEQDAVQ
ncbi:LysR family transcriptional regulator [Cedecea sp. NFIX57]|jgi:DNA-binding transcriptional LysR family regulator|uniref:LysR family transcriptional regulator n=1 Tax=Cedecea sp. NFIX57 TaxID=1566286 RepID=UPI000A0A609B|nr:LysR family transcriptional regulator [Cedecea sp. NFIX57]SMG61789.1 DNA-binding transcriptional regulator, LysR family [Cedecea sp. NFIX57]